MSAKIIAEVCQNHDGSRANLAEMIHAAAENGADIVKMQSIWAADVTKRERFEQGQVDAAGKQTSIKRPFQAEVDRLSKLDLSLDDHLFFVEECTKHGVLPMTAIFARHRVQAVAALRWPGSWIKVPSYDCASLPILSELAEYFDNFIISTGATFDEEIARTVEHMKKLGKNFVLLHCVTSYPNTLDMCNLARMDWLRQFTPQVGWSDHSKISENGIVAAKAAILLGADYVERHFTTLPPAQTKDGPISMSPDLLKDLVRYRSLPKDAQQRELDTLQPDWRLMIGSPTREMTHTELLNRDYYRGRFASPDGRGGWIYNWEDKPLTRE
jgi:sialic acid synthase SpsE